MLQGQAINDAALVKDARQKSTTSGLAAEWATARAAERTRQGPSYRRANGDAGEIGL